MSVQVAELYEIDSEQWVVWAGCPIDIVCMKPAAEACGILLEATIHNQTRLDYHKISLLFV